MNRYTGKQLETDVKELNGKLACLGSDLFFVVGYRYGYTAIDLATREQLEQHCCQRNLEIGIPRQCLAACQRYVLSKI